MLLTNKFEVPEDDVSDTKALFVRTKRMVVDVIRFQQGKTLKDILETPATDEMEAEHLTFNRKRRAELDEVRACVRVSVSARVCLCLCLSVCHAHVQAPFCLAPLTHARGVLFVCSLSVACRV